MARTAIISDIHANLHALSAVMEDIQTEQCTDIVCLGDVVGYNAYPAECVDAIHSFNCPVVKGNHDAEVCNATNLNMNEMARMAMNWTRSRLSEEQLLWLGRLQYMRIVRSEFTIVHSSLDQPKAWNYIINANDASTNFRRQFSPICFHGHTHVPKAFCLDPVSGRTYEEFSAVEHLYVNGVSEFILNPHFKYFINVGSVGQPRDNDPRACYAIYDSEYKIVKLKRVVYDVQAASDAVRTVGLPDYLADRLLRGC